MSAWLVDDNHPHTPSPSPLPPSAPLPIVYHPQPTSQPILNLNHTAQPTVTTLSAAHQPLSSQPFRLLSNEGGVQISLPSDSQNLLSLSGIPSLPSIFSIVKMEDDGQGGGVVGGGGGDLDDAGIMDMIDPYMKKQSK